MYTEATGNTATYVQVSQTEAIWDNDDSKWDFNGNFYASQWDILTKSYTEASGNSIIYEEVIPSESVWDSGATTWDLSGNVVTSNWDT